MRQNASCRSSRRPFVIAALAAAAILSGQFAGPARAAEFRVDIDQAKLIRLDKAGTEVIVGNPSIADVSVQSGRILVVTGKSVGLTNLMVLDAGGELIYNKKLSVSADAEQLVTVNKGIARHTYSCSPLCGPALIPGDAVAFADELSKAIRAKLGLAQAAAEGTSAQQ